MTIKPSRKVKCFGIQEEWFIIATNEEVSFSHLYRPTEAPITVKGL
jgi:hypothetical protein